MTDQFIVLDIHNLGSTAWSIVGGGTTDDGSVYNSPSEQVYLVHDVIPEDVNYFVIE